MRALPYSAVLSYAPKMKVGESQQGLYEFFIDYVFATIQQGNQVLHQSIGSPPIASIDQIVYFRELK